MSESIKDIIIAIAQDAAADVMYYDRKEDEVVPRGRIETAIQSGEVTIKDIVTAFEETIRSYIDECDYCDIPLDSDGRCTDECESDQLDGMAECSNSYCT